MTPNAITAPSAPTPIYSASKAGNGSFDLRVLPSGETLVNGRSYPSPQDAYDRFREAHERTGDHAAWNVCYHLEDVLETGCC